MKRFLILIFTLSATTVAGQDRPATAPQGSATVTAESAVQKKVESFMRKLYAWGPTFRVKIGPLRNSPVSGFYEVSVDVSTGEQSDSAVIYVSRDGRYLFRGDVQDMDSDPLAAVRAQIHLANSPTRGPADARVTVVEYSDFQCPSCRQLYQTLREIVPRYPQVRFVFKDFPLVQIHPWAMTAAIAGRCAFEQNPDAFWKLHDSIFENQGVISAENAWQKMMDYSGQAGLNADNFRTCMASPEANQAVQASIKEGQGLKIGNTPTVFVNGRRMVGGDPGLLDQYIQYEAATPPTP
ncbi:MAG TPA: thioredoxin domain-containing protein [Candidatus Acidoferrales bacterium]|nr:thioredoxin domain-containing protein [Candidatus Acidoferrales bacterium]